MPYKDIEKQRKFDRLWKRNKRVRSRLKVIDLLGGKCIDCSNSDFRVLEIDHIEPIKRDRSIKTKLDSGALLTRGLLSGKYKMSSVKLRCANCHKIKTFQERVKYKNWRG